MIAYMRQLGHNLVLLMPLEAVDPGWGAGMPGIDPGYGVEVHPHPDHGLPGHGAHPGHDLPTIPGVPDNSLPTTPPPAVPSNMVLVMVRMPDGKWHWAAVPAAAAPSPLPVPPMAAQPKS